MSKIVGELEGATDLALTLIEISRSVNQGAETIEIFSNLAQRCVELLPVAGAGILLRDSNDMLQVIGASSPSAHLLDLFQVQNEQGPCLACCETGESVADETLDSNGPWPRFSALAQAHGFTAVYALPLKSKHVSVGALNLFAKQPLSDEKLFVAQALADAATLSLLQVDPELDLQIIIRRIHLAVESRNTLEQAQGMIAQRFSVDIETALIKIRQVAGVTQLSLVQVARHIIARDESSPVHQLLIKP
jgi:hypothetical protein